MILLLAVPVVSAQEANQRYELSNFDVRIDVRPDGTYEVEESITYDFQEGRFTYAYRSLEVDDAASLRNVRVTSPETAVDSLHRTEEGDNVRLRWTYPERSASTTFTIRYEIDGALYERGSRNVVSRDVLDPEATVPTRDVDVRVALPPAFDLAPDSVSASPVGDATVERSAGQVVAAFHRERVESGDSYTIEVAFPRRTSGAYLPTVGDILIAVILGLLGIGAGGWAHVRWRGPRVERQSARPPDDVSLPAAPLLLELQGHRAFPAVLFDLARRGHLTLRHDREERLLGTSEVVQVDLHPERGQLSSFEAALIDRLADDDTLDDFWSGSGSFRRQQVWSVRQRLIDAGWMASHRRRSNLLFTAAGALLVAGFTIGLGGTGFSSLLALAGGLGGGIGAGIAGLQRYSLTTAGAQRAAALRSFLDHEKTEVDRLLDTNPSRAAERLGASLPWLLYHDDVSASWLETVRAALDDADAVPDLPDGFVSQAEGAEASDPVAAFVPVVAVMSATESSAAGGAAGGAAGAAAGGGGAAGAG